MFRKLFLVGALVALSGVSATSAAETDARHRAKALEIYKTIIAMRTAEGRGQVPAMAEYLAKEFRDAGFADEDIHILPLDATAALVVRYRGDGSSGKKPILFLGHMDVVDALAEDWERPPFAVTEDENYFFGRGTIDNKYGIMNLTQTFIRLKEQGFVPNRDLVIAFSGDEESTMLTTRMLAYDRKDLTAAEFALNSDAGGGALGEQGPLVYRLQAAEKTYATFELTVSNPGGHSSWPRADNAINELAESLTRIADYRFPVMATPLTRGYLAATGAALKNPTGEMLSRFAQDPDDQEAANYLADQPAYVGITRTTCIATMLRAGHAENALPQSATATINCRIFPGSSVKEVQATLANIAGNDGIEIKVLDDPTVSPASIPRDDVMAALRKAIDSRYPGLPIVPYMASGGTDGMHFRNAGIPTFAMSGIFLNPKDMFAHGLNERNLIESFYAGLDHWVIIIQTLTDAARQ